MATNTYVALATYTIPSAVSSYTFSSIPSTYTDLVLVYNGIQTADANLLLQLNGDTANNYSVTNMNGSGSAASSYRQSNQPRIVLSTGYNSTNRAALIVNIMNYANITTYKTVMSRFNLDYVGAAVGLWRSTSAINSVTLFTDAGNISSGATISLYGIAAADVGAKATGGIVSSDSTYYYHTFASSGTFTPLQSLTCDYLVVAGGGGAGGPETAFGGGGWYGGGGGAGGLRSTVTATGGGGSLETALSLSATGYTVTIGAGGAGGAGGTGNGVSGTNGSNSVFSTITSTGGGGGARGVGNGTGTNGLSGGSGGGGGSAYLGSNTSGGAGTTNQGYAGGAGLQGSGQSGNGGGAGAIGGSYASRSKAVGVATSISGTSITYGVGGAGYGPDANNIAGSANTGNGGDIGVSSNTAGLAGGSGIVIVRYAK